MEGRWQNDPVRHGTAIFTRILSIELNPWAAVSPRHSAYPVRDHIDGGSYQQGLQPAKRGGQCARSAHDSQEFEHDSDASSLPRMDRTTHAAPLPIRGVDGAVQMGSRHSFPIQRIHLVRAEWSDVTAICLPESETRGRMQPTVNMSACRSR